MVSFFAPYNPSDNIPIAEIGKHWSIAPEILGSKKRDFWLEILHAFYLSQNWGFFDIVLNQRYFNSK